MKLVTRADLARMAGVSKPAIGKAIKEGKLTLIGKGRSATIDATAKNSIDYINQDRPERPDNFKIKKSSSNQTNLKDQPPDTPQPYGEEIPTDLNAMSLLTANRLKAIEAVKQAQIKNAKDRGKLIDRELVRRLLAQIFTIDVNEWRTLSANLTPELAAAFAIHNPEKLIEAEALIDREVFAILQHSKRLINDFLKSIQAEGLKDETDQACTMPPATE